MLIHTVIPGETLFSIAARYGVSASRIRLANDLAEGEELIVGQNLLILFPAGFYTLSEDMTPERLSERTGLSERELYRYNPSLTRGVIPEGTTVVLSYDETKNGALATVGYAYPFISPERLENALPYLTELALFTYGFDENGALIAPQSDDLPPVRRALDAGTAPVLLLSTLGRDGRFNSALASALFENPAAKERLLSELLSVMREKGYAGLDVDFEYIAPEKKEDYAAFIGFLTGNMNENGYSVTVALAPKTSRGQPGLLYEAHDYRALGEKANRLLLMTYEWGYTYGPPQAVAPIAKVEAVVNYALTEIPAKKLLLGIPNYGYDWTLPYTPGTAARSLSTVEALDLARRYGAEILFDDTAASPYFYYTDDDGRAHAVWFEDPRSFAAKLSLIAEKGLAGCGIWTVMRPAQQLFFESAVGFEIEDRI